MKELVFRVFDRQINKYLEPIYEAYNGKVFEFMLTSLGSLIFRCEGMESEGFPNGQYHESIITNNEDRFVVEI